MPSLQPSIDELYCQDRLGVHVLEEIPCTVWEHDGVNDKFIAFFNALNGEAEWFDSQPDRSLKQRIQPLRLSAPVPLHAVFTQVGFLFDRNECRQLSATPSSERWAVTAKKIKAIIVSQEEEEGKWDVTDSLRQAMNIRDWLTETHPELFTEPLPIIGHDSRRSVKALSFDVHRRIFKEQVRTALEEEYQGHLFNAFLDDEITGFLTLARESREIEAFRPIAIKQLVATNSLALQFVAAQENPFPDRSELMLLLLDHGAKPDSFQYYPTLLGTPEIYGATDDPEIAGHLLAHARLSFGVLPPVYRKHEARMQAELKTLLANPPAERAHHCLAADRSIRPAFRGVMAVGLLSDFFAPHQWQGAERDAQALYGALRAAAAPRYRQMLQDVDMTFCAGEWLAQFLANERKPPLSTQRR